MSVNIFGQILLPADRAKSLVGFAKYVWQVQAEAKSVPFGPADHLIVDLDERAVNYLQTRGFIDSGFYTMPGGGEHKLVTLDDIRQLIERDNFTSTNVMTLVTELFTQQRAAKCASCGRYDATERPCGAVLCDADGCITPHEAGCFDCDEQYVPESDRD